LRSEGLSEDDARWKARREFGSVRAAEERFYLKGRWLLLDKLARDLRFGLRALRQSPDSRSLPSSRWLSAWAQTPRSSAS